MRQHPQVQALLPAMRAVRRALHRMPEPSGEEYKTQQYLLNTLKEYEPDELISMDTGIRAVYFGQASAGQVLAFRADMDALPITEASEKEYISGHPGWMHACGHDGHMAMLVGLAAYIHWARQEGKALPTVVLLFQPAEESVGGAEPLIAAGALENPHVDRIYGFHMMPELPLGKVGLKPGPLMAENAEFDIEIQGTRAHGALPYQGRDALLAANHLYMQMQSLLTRGMDPFDPLLLSVGRMEAGEMRNIVAPLARMECMTRTYSAKAYPAFRAKVIQLLEGLEAAYGVTGRFVDGVRFPAVVNDQMLAEEAQALWQDAAMPVEAMLVADDFSFFQKERPGLYAFIGCRDEEHQAALHSNCFDFDEQALAVGLELYRRILER